MNKNLNKLILNKLFLFAFIFLLGTVASASASTITDFTWVSSTSAYSASTIVDGVEISIETDNLPFEFSIGAQGSGVRFFDISSDIDTTITLSFNQTIESLRLYIQDLDNNGESLINLSTATTAVDGDLFSSGNSVFSNGLDDDGNLIWNNLYANSISFDYIRNAGHGLFLNELEFVTASTSTVPEPATMLLFGLGILGIVGVSRKKTA